MLATLSSTAGRQSKGTEKQEAKVNQFLDYCANHPNAGVHFVASDMLLALHSDALYLSEPNGRSHTTGHHFLLIACQKGLSIACMHLFLKQSQNKFNQIKIVILIKHMSVFSVVSCRWLWRQGKAIRI